MTLILLAVFGNFCQEDKVKQLIVAVLRQGAGDSGEQSKQVPSDYAQEIVSQGVLDIIVYWLNQLPVLPPEDAYRIFRQTRMLTPEELTRQIKWRLLIDSLTQKHSCRLFAGYGIISFQILISKAANRWTEGRHEILAEFHLNVWRCNVTCVYYFNLAETPI